MIAAMLLLAMLAEDPGWRAFAEWFLRAGTPGAPAEVLQAYGAKLRADGAGAAEVAARVEAVGAYLAAHPREGLVLHFNRMYTWPEAPFRREASALVQRVAGTRRPGRALDIAMGQGRNAIWLARQGWTVSGYDLSDEALRQAEAGARAAGVRLETKLASHEEYELGTEAWDLIVMSYAFTKLSDGAYMQRVHDALKPGGVLLVEGFHGGPRTEANLVLKAFLGYRVLLFEDLPDVADWGQRQAPLLRMALERR